MSSLAYAPSGIQDDNDPEVLIQFEDSAFEAAIPSEENFEDQVREAQEQLEQLRQREEQLERQKRELEDLHDRKAAFVETRNHVNEELTRAIGALEREADECQRRADQCINSKDSLDHYLRTVESLRPEMWNRAQLKEELSRSQIQLNEAEEELGGISPLLSSIFGGKGGSRATAKRPSIAGSDISQNFIYWFKSGLAFTLPVMIFLAVFGLFFMAFGGS